ncbi:hypothetical protein [Halobacillus faecis]|uniref:DUF3221 domain-containing protein n=1 Tax=Halobacillus faecis TaxID=360184 RepID=A0A511WP97_9BACI|nr:hypothetical protein [Halobacillus faecis]GEN52331.1 hypothetical protein HFA01_05930 [Halobacillus faecis]
MRKIASISLAIIVLILSIFFFTKPDLHGKISGLNIDKNFFTLFPLRIDPEAEYDLPEIRFDNDTMIVGKISETTDLSDGQEGKIWVTEIEEAKYATKIKVIK